MRRINLMPSILILHDVKLRGGIQYRVMDRIAELEEKKETAEWKTKRTIFDKVEFDAGRALRARIENLMRTATSAASSDIGLFAPDTPQTFDAIRDAEREIQALIDTFHTGAYYNRISSRVITFRIQSDNTQALEAVSDLIQDGLEDLKTAVKAADVKSMRAALKDLKGFDKLLPDTASAELQKLINDMRKKARDLNRLVNKQGKKLDDSDVTTLLDAANIDAAEMVIFEIEETDTGDAIPAADVDEFTPAEIPTAPATVEQAQTDETTAADFQPDVTPEPQPATTTDDNNPAQTLTGDILKQPELVTDETPEHQHGDDWKEDTAAEIDTERDTVRAELLDEYEATNDDDRRADIRAALETLDAAKETATAGKE